MKAINRHIVFARFQPLKECQPENPVRSDELGQELGVQVSKKKKQKRSKK